MLTHNAGSTTGRLLRLLWRQQIFFAVVIFEVEFYSIDIVESHFGSCRVLTVLLLVEKQYFRPPFCKVWVE